MDIDKKKRFEVALLCRNMEIDLFWKRSSYYWVFVGAALVAYGALKKDFPNICLLITSFGLISSVAWMLGNIGSKWWIENWEKKLHDASHPIVGDLFVPYSEKFPIGFGVSLSRFSVTKLAVLISMFSTILWLGLFFKETLMLFPNLRLRIDFLYRYRWAALIALTFVFLVMMVTLGKGKNRVWHKHKIDEPAEK
jgi:hypothetical protein